ncbi:NAD(P)-binding protein [Aquimonas voraii]|uniref:Amine oxidase domain-containing protein n=1 Tax=Aquimonas voraii TaxID=265719 RepID=A0A1G6WY19_9GAMM|nr:NAD(P)-binding protein [Aquimonas voraii]SDD69956.1 hypothetical protein SAMN04488509_105191 [Aquimonas voraii]
MPTLPLQANTVVIGAGLTGSLIARGLSAAGDSVAVIDKGRGPGGRLSVRRTDSGSFAHGCPLSTVSAWLQALPREPLQALGLPDSPGVDDPRVQALPRHLLEGIASRFGAQVVRIERAGERWRLWDADAALLAEARRLVLTAPAPQSAALLAGLQPEWSRRLGALGLAPAWALLLAQDATRPGPDWAKLASPALRVLPQDSLPEADAAGPAVRRWVVQLGDAHSAALLEASPAQVLDAVLGLLGLGTADFLHSSAHRWRYARVLDPLPEPALVCARSELAVCGDAFAGTAGAAGPMADLQRCLASARALLDVWKYRTLAV